MEELKKKLRIVFFGTPSFAVESLKRLTEDPSVEIAAVVTAPDKIGGRGHKILESDVKKFAMQKSIPVLQPIKLKSKEFISQLEELDADLFIVIAFRMLPETVWSMPPLGTFNLHASLLPKYRGAAPINWAIMNGENKTGVTTFFLKHEIDTGDIIEQREIDIEETDDFGSLYDKLMKIGAEMVKDTVSQIAENKLNTRPQPEGEFAPAPKIFKETCRINWENKSKEIHNQIRGLSPLPGAWCLMSDSRTPDEVVEVKIFESKLTDEIFNKDLKAGDIYINKGKLFVQTGDKWLEILNLQPSGKKRMNANAFVQGYSPLFFK